MHCITLNTSKGRCSKSKYTFHQTLFLSSLNIESLVWNHNLKCFIYRNLFLLQACHEDIKDPNLIRKCKCKNFVSGDVVSTLFILSRYCIKDILCSGLLAHSVIKSQQMATGIAGSVVLQQTFVKWLLIQPLNVKLMVFRKEITRKPTTFHLHNIPLARFPLFCFLALYNAFWAPYNYENLKTLKAFEM